MHSWIGTSSHLTKRICCVAEAVFTWHRDGVGAINIRSKYREEFGIPLVVGVITPPIGLRYAPHIDVAREQLREAAGL